MSGRVVVAGVRQLADQRPDRRGREGRTGRGTASGSCYRVEVTGGELRDEVDESTDAAAWFSATRSPSLPRTELVDAALDYLDANASDVHTEISIDVDRPPRRVFDLARDISRWPRLLPHYRTGDHSVTQR